MAEKKHLRSCEALSQRVLDLENQISRLETVEKTLRESEGLYRLLTESATEMILLSDTCWRVVYANRATFALSGYSEEEILGQDIGRFFGREEWERIRAHLENDASSVVPGELCETAFIHHDGYPIHIEVSFTRVAGTDRTAGALFTARDIRERMAMEKELQKARKLESIGVLAGGIAHDYNNLLTAMLGYLTLAESLLPPDVEAQAHLGRARQAAVMAKDLSRKLITFSRGGKPIKKPGSLVPTLEHAVSLALAGSNIASEIQCPDTLWSVEFDEAQISQAIHNIIMNAREAMSRGGTLRVTAENLSIRKQNGHLVGPGDWVRITIEDEGIGIPETLLDKIFDPYFSTKEMGPQKGLGLGLAITHSVILNHQGFVFAESEPGRGTALHVYLPAASTRSARRGSRTPARAALCVDEKPRVLVMDDDAMVRDITQKMLERSGWDVTLANNGDEAVHMFRHGRDQGHPFHVVILDLTVRGGMGGKETVRRLLEMDPNVKAVVSSGYSDDPVMTDFPGYGFCAAVTKPYSMDDLKKTMANVHHVGNAMRGADADPAPSAAAVHGPGYA